MRPRLVGSAEGSIARVLLTAEYAVRSQPLAAAYRDLLGSLPAETGFLVLAHESVVDTVEPFSFPRYGDT